jgi:hypothetical protein
MLPPTIHTHTHIHIHTHTHTHTHTHRHTHTHIHIHTHPHPILTNLFNIFTYFEMQAYPYLYFRPENILDTTFDTREKVQR